MTATLSGLTYWRHYVSTPSGERIIMSRNSDFSTSKAFVLADHLGSSDTVVNGLTGALILKDSSSPFGQRRQSNWTAGVPSTWYQTALTEGTRRGFTFHEQLDGVGFNPHEWPRLRPGHWTLFVGRSRSGGWKRQSKTKSVRLRKQSTSREQGPDRLCSLGRLQPRLDLCLGSFGQDHLLCSWRKSSYGTGQRS